MSWKDGFSSTGDFRGAEFRVRESELEAGRRVQAHEYPQRDTPHVEDLGRKARRLKFEAYCIGDNYKVARDALIAKVEQPGAGSLNHPYHGTLTVTVTSFRVRESTRHGGYAAITIECVESGENTFPTATASTQTAVKRIAASTSTSSMAVFAESFEIDDSGSDVPDFLAELDAIFKKVEHATGTVSSVVADLLSTPGQLGEKIASIITGISASAADPLQALNLLTTLFNAGSDPVITNSSPRAQQAAQNVKMTNELVRTQAVTEAAIASATLELSPAKQGNTPITRDRVYEIRTEILSAIDARQRSTDVVTGEPINDALFTELADLRTAVAIDLSTRGSRLPAVQRYVPGATLPALVVSHQLYGDASRETELLNLNNTRHPGFVAGGQSIEVLSE